MKIGSRILERRSELGLTQNELAKKSGLSRQAIVKYENNQRTPPIDAASQIAAALGVSTSWLIGESEFTHFSEHVFHDTFTRIITLLHNLDCNDEEKSTFLAPFDTLYLLLHGELSKSSKEEVDYTYIKHIGGILRDIFKVDKIELNEKGVVYTKDLSEIKESVCKHIDKLFDKAEEKNAIFKELWSPD